MGIWVHRPFGLTSPVAGGHVRIEDANATFGRTGVFVGTWSGQGSLSDVSIMADVPDPVVPLVLRADSRLLAPRKLCETELQVADSERAAATDLVTLGSGGSRDSDFQCVLHATEEVIQWWTTSSAMRVDLTISVIPEQIWAHPEFLPASSIEDPGNRSPV